MVKGNDEYPSMVMYAYTMVLDWTPDPSLVGGGAVQHKVPHVDFANVRRDKGERTYDKKCKAHDGIVC